MKEKTTPPHSWLIGKQMRIDNLEKENKHLKELISGIINPVGKGRSAVQNAGQLSSSDAQGQERLQPVLRLQTPFHSSWASSVQPDDRVQTAIASNHKQAPLVSHSLQPPQPSGPVQPHHVSNTIHSQHKSSHLQSSGYSQMQSSHASSHLPLQCDFSQMQSPQANSQLQSPLFPNPMHTENVSTHKGKGKSDVQNAYQLSSSGAQGQEQLQRVQRLQTPFHSSWASSNQPNDRVKTEIASNHKQVPFVSPSLQPPQPSGSIQPCHVPNTVHSQHKSSHIQSSGYSQMQSSHAYSRLPLQSDCSQMQPPLPHHMHTAYVSTHNHSSTAPSHSGHVQVPPLNDERTSGIGTKPFVNTFRSPSHMPNSYFAASAVHDQFQSLYSQKFPNVHQNRQHFNYRPPCPQQNLPLSHPWPSRPHLEAPNEHSALQQGHCRKYPYTQPSNFQHNTSTTNPSFIQSQMQQPLSNALNHGLISAQNHSLQSLTRMSYSQSSRSPQLQSAQYQHSAELNNDLHQVDRLRNPAVPFPSPQHFQQQLSQNTSVPVNRSRVQMLGVQQGFRAGIPFQGSLNTQSTNSTQVPLSSSSSQLVDVHSESECLQSKMNSSVNEQNNENMGLDDFLSELHRQSDTYATKRYMLPIDKSQLCENLSKDSVSVSEIIKENENELSHPTKLQRSAGIVKKDHICSSRSVNDSLPSTVSSSSDKSFSSPPPSTLTPPLTPPVKCFSRSEDFSSCHESSTSANHNEKETLSVDGDSLPPYSTTDKSYVAKTSVTELAESLQSSKSTQSNAPVSDTLSDFSEKGKSTRHNDGNQETSVQSRSFSQDDSAQNPSEIILYDDDGEPSYPEVAVTYPKTSIFTSLPQAVVPGSLSISSPSELPVSQNAFCSSSSVNGTAKQAAHAVPVVMLDSNNGECSHSTSSENEKLQQHEVSKKPAYIVSNNNSSDTVSSTIYSQPVKSHVEFLKHSVVTENLSAGQTMHKAQELSVPSNSPPSVSLVNGHQQMLLSKFKHHPKVNAKTKKYLPIPGIKTVQFPEGSEVFCYVCRKHVNGKDILKHLFFGDIKCSRCDCKINRCIDLEGITLKKFICNERKLMMHEFNVWAINPVDFLGYRMWSKSREMCKKSSPEEQLQGLSRYLQTLSSLKSVEPWSTAFLRCTKYTKSMLKDLKLPVEEMKMPRELNINSEIAKPNLENAENLQTLSSVYRREKILNHIISDESVGKTTEKPKSAIMTIVEGNIDPENGCHKILSSSSQQVINDENAESLGSAGIGANVMPENELKNYGLSDIACVTASRNNDDLSDCHNTESASNILGPDCLLDTSYTMDLFEKVVEYVEIHDESKELQMNISSIPKNNHCSSGVCDPSSNGESTALQLMNKDTPECSMVLDLTDSEENSNKARNDLKIDERHLIIETETDKMSHNILEECPLCYEVLCPSQFTVNTKSFTVSTMCTECDLIITIRPKNSISKDNLRDAHYQERKRPGPKSKGSGIKRHRGITR